jgi:ABC-type lipoprotein export system ATPase subunit
MEIKVLSWNEPIIERSYIQLLPRFIRGLVIGKSGCGKTTLLLDLLLKPDWLDYDHFYVLGTSLIQPEYRILKKSFEQKLHKETILNLFNHQDEIMQLEISPELVIEEYRNKHLINQTLNANFMNQQMICPDPRDLSSVSIRIF